MEDQRSELVQPSPPANAQWPFPPANPPRTSWILRGYLGLAAVFRCSMTKWTHARYSMPSTVFTSVDGQGKLKLGVPARGPPLQLLQS